MLISRRGGSGRVEDEEVCCGVVFEVWEWGSGVMAEIGVRLWDVVGGGFLGAGLGVMGRKGKVCG